MLKQHLLLPRMVLNSLYSERARARPESGQVSNSPWQVPGLSFILLEPARLSKQSLGKPQPRGYQSDGTPQPCASLKELETASPALQPKSPNHWATNQSHSNPESVCLTPAISPQTSLPSLECPQSCLKGTFGPLWNFNKTLLLTAYEAGGLLWDFLQTLTYSSG